MSESFSVRCCKMAAMRAGSQLSVLTALRIHGSAARANASGDMALMYSLLKYVSFSISKMAGDFEMRDISNASASSLIEKISRSPPGAQPRSAT